MIKVKDHPDYARDENSGAIINVNTAAYRNAIAAAKKMKEKDHLMESMGDDIDRMKQQIEELRELIANRPSA